MKMKIIFKFFRRRGKFDAAPVLRYSIARKRPETGKTG